MSCSKWAYTPEVCDGEYCVGDCDHCRIVATIDELMGDECEKCNFDDEKAERGLCHE